MSVFIIAEAGVNHNGDINLAKELIKYTKSKRILFLSTPFDFEALL